MDRLERLFTFVQIVEEGSLSAAARRSGLTVPAVSKQLRVLEAELGAELIRRTTRSMTLTPSGTTVYHRARRLLADYEETRDLVTGVANTSPVRVVADSGAIRAVVVPALTPLVASRTGLRVELRPWTEGNTQLPGDADLALVAGVVDDSPARVARRLSDAPRVLCAAPAYLASSTPPSHPADLTRHACLLGGALGRSAVWPVRRPDEPGAGTPVLVDGPLRASSDEALREAALGGLGIALLPPWLVAEDLDAGRLRRVLPDVWGPPAPLHVVYMRDRGESSRLSPIIDALVAQCGARARPTAEPGRRSA